MRVRRRRVEASETASAFLAADPAREDRVVGARRARGLSDLEVSVERAEACARSGDWSGADARTFVGLYAWCHRSVYGVLPVELDGDLRVASRAALNVLHKHFADDGAAMALFVKWSWTREKGRAQWARGKGFDRNRMGWRLQFSERQVTDYLVARSERRGG